MQCQKMYVKTELDKELEVDWWKRRSLGTEGFMC